MAFSNDSNGAMYMPVAPAYMGGNYGGGRDQLAGKLRRMLGDAPDEKSRNAIMNALNTIEK